MRWNRSALNDNGPALAGRPIQISVSLLTGQTLTSGTFGTEPRGGDEPPSPPLGPPGGRGLRGPRRFALAGAGTFSGFGVIGPSGNSKPILSRPFSSLRTITRTWPPDLSLPNSTSSASGFLIVSWI